MPLHSQTRRFARLINEVEAYAAKHGIKLQMTTRIRRAMAPLDAPAGTMPEEEIEPALARIRDECEIEVARQRRRAG